MENTNTGPTGGAGHFEGNKQILPNSTAVLILGIVSIVGVLCTQGIMGIILGIIGLVLSGTPMRMVRENPEAYTEASIKNLKAGRICSIIGVSLGGAFFLLVITLILFGLAGGFFALLPFLENITFPEMISLMPLL
ncbi:MAG: CCC motif membrane protein [Bacteroidales bacterium]